MRCSRQSAFTLATGLALTLSSSGCLFGTAPVQNPFDDSPPTAGPSRTEAWSPDEVTRAEIVEKSALDLNAMSLIRRLRPGWLRARGQNSFDDPQSAYPLVYIDEIRHGRLGTLNGIPSSEIQRLEFHGTADATTRWGTGHPAGVINVVTGRAAR